MTKIIKLISIILSIAIAITSVPTDALALRSTSYARAFQVRLAASSGPPIEDPLAKDLKPEELKASSAGSLQSVDHSQAESSLAYCFRIISYGRGYGRTMPQLSAYSGLSESTIKEKINTLLNLGLIAKQEERYCLSWDPESGMRNLTNLQFKQAVYEYLNEPKFSGRVPPSSYEEIRQDIDQIIKGQEAVDIAKGLTGDDLSPEESVKLIKTMDRVLGDELAIISRELKARGQGIYDPNEIPVEKADLLLDDPQLCGRLRLAITETIVENPAIVKMFDGKIGRPIKIYFMPGDILWEVDDHFMPGYFSRESNAIYIKFEFVKFVMSMYPANDDRDDKKKLLLETIRGICNRLGEQELGEDNLFPMNGHQADMFGTKNDLDILQTINSFVFMNMWFLSGEGRLRHLSSDAFLSHLYGSRFDELFILAKEKRRYELFQERCPANLARFNNSHKTRFAKGMRVEVRPGAGFYRGGKPKSYALTPDICLEVLNELWEEEELWDFIDLKILIDRFPVARPFTEGVDIASHYSDMLALQRDENGITTPLSVTVNTRAFEYEIVGRKKIKVDPVRARRDLKEALRNGFRDYRGSLISDNASVVKSVKGYTKCADKRVRALQCKSKLVGRWAMLDSTSIWQMSYLNWKTGYEREFVDKYQASNLSSLIRPQVQECFDMLHARSAIGTLGPDEDIVITELSAGSCKHAEKWLKIFEETEDRHNKNLKNGEDPVNFFRRIVFVIADVSVEELHKALDPKKMPYLTRKKGRIKKLIKTEIDINDLARLGLQGPEDLAIDDETLDYLSRSVYMMINYTYNLMPFGLTSKRDGTAYSGLSRVFLSPDIDIEFIKRYKKHFNPIGIRTEDDLISFLGDMERYEDILQKKMLPYFLLRKIWDGIYVESRFLEGTLLHKSDIMKYSGTDNVTLPSNDTFVNSVGFILRHWLMKKEGTLDVVDTIMRDTSGFIKFYWYLRKYGISLTGWIDGYYFQHSFRKMYADIDDALARDAHSAAAISEAKVDLDKVNPHTAIALTTASIINGIRARLDTDGKSVDDSGPAPESTTQTIADADLIASSIAETVKTFCGDPALAEMLENLESDTLLSTCLYALLSYNIAHKDLAAVERDRLIRLQLFNDSRIDATTTPLSDIMGKETKYKGSLLRFKRYNDLAFTPAQDASLAQLAHARNDRITPRPTQRWRRREATKAKSSSSGLSIDHVKRFNVSLKINSAA
ncbi:hypothetical protein ACFL0T_04360 [Candidatus Omnitrophota bacterium]